MLEPARNPVGHRRPTLRWLSTFAAQTPMALTVAPVPLAALTPEREAHFARLAEGPDLYLELLLQRGTAYRIGWGARPAGHCLLSEDGQIAELDLPREAWQAKNELFAALVERLEVRGARCFSFDPLLLGLCIERGWTASVEGALFRDLLDEHPPVQRDDLRLRPATTVDLELILPHREGVFDSEDECRAWVAGGRVSVLERDGAFLGIGLLTRIWASRPEHDVGVMVHPDHRGRGYASYIARALKRRCLDLGLRPVAGCHAENLASVRALHRAGFASQHALLQFRPARAREA